MMHSDRNLAMASSLTSLYADISLYRSVCSHADYVILQADITAITTWSWVEEVRLYFKATFR